MYTDCHTLSLHDALPICQLPDGAMTLVESVDDVAALTPPDPEKLAFLTQTPLSVDDTRDIVAALEHRFPTIQGPRGEDICYATSNRQQAVQAIAPRCDRLIVIGAPNSSHSRPHVAVAARHGTPPPPVPQRSHTHPTLQAA